MASLGNSMQDGGRPVQDTPDKLQDLCIFYCMNNLDILVASLNNVSESNDDVSSTFSLLLGNRLMEYFLSNSLPSEDKQQFVDQLTQNNQLCNEVILTRRDVVSSENIQELANNSIRRLHLSIFDDSTSEVIVSYEELLENNLPYLTKVSLSQKCEESQMTGFLNLLCGQEVDADIETVGGNADDLDNSINASGDQNRGKYDNPSFYEMVVSNTKFHGFQIRNLDGQNEGSGETVQGAEKNTEDQSDIAPNLKSFSYECVYMGMRPPISAHHCYGWFYHLLTEILLRNKQIQSFCLVTVISNPVKWFLSQPKIHSMKNIQSLCLSFNCPEQVAELEERGIPYTKEFFSNLPLLENLRHLDVSCNYEGGNSGGIYCYSDRMVALFTQSVKKMTQLKSIDISGTNLASIISHSNSSDTECTGHCMPGFEGRQFDFLGLYGNEECRHSFIPARRVSGDANLDQLLVALWSLQHNKAIMLSVLNELQLWVQAHFVTAKQGLPMIDGLVEYMAKIGDWDSSYVERVYYEEKSVCVTLHCLYFLLRSNEVKNHITIIQKRQLMERLFVICHNLSLKLDWKSSNQEVRNKILRVAMLLVLILDLEVTVVYSYRFEQYIQLLLEIFHGPAKPTQKLLSLRLLHSACRISQEYKAVAGGKVQLVKRLLMIVMERVTRVEQVDEIMEKVWSILWSLTDEVPSNCELFVNHAGCQMAKTCIEKYRDAKPLHRKITGAMSNVSENSNLLSSLMTTDLVILFKNLLAYKDEEDFDVSSHAAGFLIMLASHGPDAWTIVEPTCTRDHVLEEVDKVMIRWDINKPKGVKFRSLTPMLTQLDNYSTPVAQVWGAWLICNLVIVKAQSYCDMLESEDGLTRIDSVLQHEGLREDLVTLLQKIKSVTAEYKSRGEENYHL